jgi:hypothetical protein
MIFQEKESIKFEIDCRELLIKKLQTTEKSLKKMKEKEIEKNLKRLSELTKYETLEDVEWAWGYAEITSEEHDKLLKMFEKSEEIEQGGVTLASAALEILRDYTGRLKRDIRDFKWELLPDSEKDRINKSNEEFHEEIKRKREEGYERTDIV